MLRKLKNLNWFQKLLLIIIGTIIFRNAIFFNFEMLGTYISNAEEPRGEIPRKGTRLFLHRNGKYTSSSMGTGVYQIKGNELHLENENSTWSFSLCREFNIGKPKIVLFRDLNYYMYKE